MEAGHLNKRVAFIIQARMQSTRLPGKILLPLPLGKGKPLLSWITDELHKSKFNADIIIATSLSSENTVLESFCESRGLLCFRGEEDNVLSRFVQIAKRHDYDCIVRLTADNPILDIEVLDSVISHHFENDSDYTSTAVLPTGMNSEVISAKALLDQENHDLSQADREHVTLFIRNSGKYKTVLYNPDINSALTGLRLTVDYASDYALAATILSLAESNGLQGVGLVEDTYIKFPWLFETNSANIQKKQFDAMEDEVAESAKLLDLFEYKRASAILKDRL